MTTPATTPRQVALGGISIRVSGPDDFCAEHELPPGDALVIGSSPACGVRIEGPGIAPMHCTLSCEDGQVVVDDWDTGAGTYIDGQRIARQASADPGVTVQIGDYRFETAPAIEALFHETNEPLTTEHDSDPAGCAADDTDPFLRTYPDPLTAGDPQTRGPEPADQAAEALFDNAEHLDHEEHLDNEQRFHNSVVDDEDDACDAGAFEAASDEDDIYDSAEYDIARDESPAYEPPAYAAVEAVGTDDVTELQTIELEYLRNELAERDARMAELERALEGGATPHDDELPSREEVDVLAGRLEQLLEELDHSDERLKTMAELLRLSEEANVASVEEREQMESWMGEVERRVGDWESEWHGERDTLNRRIDELTAQRDEAEAQGGSRENTQLIQQLRQQISRLEAETERLQAERSGLEQRIEAADVSSVEERVQQCIDDALREERLQLSQERAEIARERAALMKQQEELTAQPSAHSSSADVADLKIRAFREHLREIRATEPDHRPPPSMSQRLGKLWRKIDGRPLDTD